MKPEMFFNDFDAYANRGFEDWEIEFIFGL